MTPSTPSTPVRRPPRLPVAGVAGRIGSHRIKRLPRRGRDVDTLDKLSTRHRDALAGNQFLPGDLAVRDTLDPLSSSRTFDAMRASQAGYAQKHACLQ